MTAIPPIDVNTHTVVDIEESSCCCWGRKVNKKPELIRGDASSNLFSDIAIPIRDANEVYNLQRSRSIIHDGKHTRTPTTYPKTPESIRSTDQHTEAKS